MATPTMYSDLAGRGSFSAARREALVLEHLPQVRLIAGRIHDRLPDSVSLDDLVSSGVVGLLAAIDNFDPERNLQLNTYAEHRIRGAIMDSLRKMDGGSRDTRKRGRVIEDAIQRLKQRLGREAEEDEIAAEIGVPLGEYQRWIADIHLLEIQPMEQVSADGETFDLIKIISDDRDSSPEQIVSRKELEELLAHALDQLSVRERTVLSLYYYEELTLREIAEVIGLHLSRVAQLRVQAILRLRSLLSRAGTRITARCN